MRKAPIKRLIDYADRSLRNRILVFLVGLLGLVIAMSILIIAYGESVASEKIYTLFKTTYDLVTPFNIILLAGVFIFYVGFLVSLRTYLRRPRRNPRNLFIKKQSKRIRSVKKNEK